MAETDPVVERRCDSCRWWTRELGEHGDCHRYPPNPKYPRPRSNEWCAEHRSRYTQRDALVPRIAVERTP